MTAENLAEEFIDGILEERFEIILHSSGFSIFSSAKPGVSVSVGKRIETLIL
ncbi:hypothetical protein ES703_97604 [subsurface metagenome]